MSGVLEVSQAWCSCLEYWRSVRLGTHVWNSGGESRLGAHVWSAGGESGLVCMAGVLKVSQAWCSCLEYWRSVRLGTHVWNSGGESRLGAHVWSAGGESGLVCMAGVLEVSQV